MVTDDLCHFPVTFIAEAKAMGRNLSGEMEPRSRQGESIPVKEL